LSALVFGSWRPSQHMNNFVTSDENAVTFVFCPSPGAGSRSASLMPRAAKKKQVKKGGGDPSKTPWGVEEEEEKPIPIDEEDELAARKAYVEQKWKAVKKMKPKFMPVGPKPWDKPRFKKVCIQVRLKAKQASNIKITNQIIEEMRRISGVHPKIVKARKNVQTFGWRVGYPCGVAATLTGDLMIDFLTRLNTVTLPRVRDFEGLVPNSFDQDGNFFMGFQNQDAFKELDAMIDDREFIHGFDVGIVNNCMNRVEGLQLMKDFGFPFGDPRPRFKKMKKGYHTLRGKKDLLG